MYSLLISSQFEKDIFLVEKRGKNMSELDVVVKILENGKKLPQRYKNHKLKNIQPETWDCHIQPDWVLLYAKDKKNKIVKLIRTGAHSDLF